jgi:hypothetical protein
VCGRCVGELLGLNLSVTLQWTVPCSHPLVCAGNVCGCCAGDSEDSPRQVLYLTPTLCYVLVTCGDAVGGGVGAVGTSLSDIVPYSHPQLRAGHMCGRCGGGHRGLTLSGTVPCSHSLLCAGHLCGRCGGGGGAARTYPVSYCTLLPPSAMCWSCLGALWRGTARTYPIRYCALLPPSLFSFEFWRVRERQERKTERESLEVGGGGGGFMTRLG